MRFEEASSREEKLGLKELLYQYLHWWPGFVVSLGIAVVLAYFVLKFSPPVFQNHVILLIHEEDPMMRLENQMFLPSLSLSSQKLQNEKGILNSRTLIHSTLRNLDFGVEYYEPDAFYSRELYPFKGFQVELDSVWPQAVNVAYSIELLTPGQWLVKARWKEADLFSFSQELFLGKSHAVRFEEIVEDGQWVEHPAFRFRVVHNPLNVSIHENKPIKVVFRDIYSLIRQYQQIEVLEQRNSSILKLSIKGRNKRKNADFLNSHANNFLHRDYSKKDRKAQETINFIDKQLLEVSYRLNQSESHLETFRSQAQILNLDYQANHFFGNLDALEDDKAKLLIKEKYYQYLGKYLETHMADDSDLLAPSSLGIDDPLLSGLIGELMKLNAERADLQINARRENPYLSNVQARILNARNTIQESLLNVRKANQLAIEELDLRIAQASERVSQMPESQRLLINMERQFKLDDAVYTFLQTKKSEIQIAKAGLSPVNEIIDAASMADAQLVAPNKKIVLGLAVILGLAFPVFLITVLEFFNDKVSATEDVTRVTNFPLLGYIARNKERNEGVVSFSSASVLAESFRSLRTNMQFVAPTEKKPVILITSTLLGEGKTFCSINIAASYAKMGKKTVLLAFDLRKPKLHAYLGLPLGKGISNFLSSELNPAEIINYAAIPNLDIVLSGQIPPNPQELIASSRTAKLFEFMQEQYDVIVVDSPPVGMVTDALLLVSYVNVILFVVRHKQTPKKYLANILDTLRAKEIANVNLILNDVPPPARYGKYQAYSYQYGYHE